MRPSLSLLAALSLTLGACQSAAPMTGVGVHREPTRAPAAATSGDERAAVPDDLVERSALPFHGVRFSDSGELSDEGLLDELAHADVICVGEEHDNPHDHWAELRIIEGLGERSRMSGRELGLGLEMFPRSTQETLDKWRVGKIDEDRLRADAHWDESWGWDFAYYRPMLEFARDRGVALVALNAPPLLAHAVAKGGLGSLSEEQGKQLPELDLDDRGHRKWFVKQMDGHPGAAARIDNYYAAQVVWDESMADRAARWISGTLPGRQLIVLAGDGHCREAAIPKRIERRVGARVVNVRPLVLDGGEDPCPRFSGYEFAFAMTTEP
jgi:uncharacterized iron-regulated protein